VTKLIVIFIFCTKANKNNEDNDRTKEIKPRNALKKERPDTAHTLNKNAT
jgi:hypothetical protein